MFVNRSKISNLYRGPSIAATYQVSVHLTKRFHRRRFFYESTNQQHELPVLAMFVNGSKMSNLYRGPSIDATSNTLAKDRQYHGQKGNWKKTDNIMAKGKLKKDRQYHGQRETDKRQTITWPKENWQKTDNIMDKRKLKKDIQYHGQKEAEKRQTLSWPKENWQKTDNNMPKGKLTKDKQ